MFMERHHRLLDLAGALVEALAAAVARGDNTITLARNQEEGATVDSTVEMVPSRVGASGERAEVLQGHPRFLAGLNFQKESTSSRFRQGFWVWVTWKLRGA